MSEQWLSAAAAAFVRRHIESVSQLEVLLALRAEPVRARSVDVLTAELRTSHGSATAALEHLHRAGLVSAEGDAYRYAGDAAATATVDELARVYANYRVRLLEMIYA